MAGFCSGFVSIVGLPNAGKSTLLNALTGAKLAIVSDKPQTTRTSIQGVLNLPGAQVIFMDTPGIHKSDSTFNRRMMQTVRGALAERDLILYVADATLPFSRGESDALDAVIKTGTPVFLLLNKIDRVRDKSKLLPLIDCFRAKAEFAEIFPVSAAGGAGLEELKQAIVKILPEGPEYFPPDHITDQPERFLAAEIVREKVLGQTRQEVPHSVAVLVDQWEDTPRLLRIRATIYVEKEGQKGILIGAGGSKLKRIGSSARLEIERLFDRKVHLELFIRVRPHWRESDEFLNEIDWRSMAGTEE